MTRYVGKKPAWHSTILKLFSSVLKKFETANDLSHYYRWVFFYCDQLNINSFRLKLVHWNRNQKQKYGEKIRNTLKTRFRVEINFNDKQFVVNIQFTLYNLCNRHTYISIFFVESHIIRCNSKVQCVLRVSNVWIWNVCVFLFLFSFSFSTWLDEILCNCQESSFNITFNFS